MSWLSEVDVQRLTLTDVGSSASGQLDESLLADLPDVLVDLLHPIGQSLEVLD